MSRRRRRKHRGPSADGARRPRDRAEGDATNERRRDRDPPRDSRPRDERSNLDPLSLPAGARRASFVVLVVILLLLGFLFYRILAAFLLPLFGAALLVVMFRPLHQWTLLQLPRHPRLAALSTTLVILLIALLPIVWVGAQAVSEGVRLAQELDVNLAKERLESLRHRFGLDLPHDAAILTVEDELVLRLAEHRGTPTIDATTLAVDHERIASRVEALEKGIRSGVDDGLGVEERESFAQQARALIEPLDEALAHAETNGGEALSSERTTALQDAILGTRELRKELAGGSFWALVKGIVNPSPQQLAEYRSAALGAVQPFLLSITRTTTSFAGRFIFWLAILTLALYYFFVDGPVMVRAVMRLSPLDDRYEERLLTQFDSISRAVVLATLLSALAQGVLAGFGFWFAGFEPVFLLTALAAIFALIPFVGAAAVWVPACLWLYFIDERPWPAVGLAAYCGVVVSMSDNLIKPYVLHGRSNMHPLLALLSVLGGVAALGPVGILVGPMVVAFFHALLEMLNREIENFDAQFAGATAAGAQVGDHRGDPEPAPRDTDKSTNETADTESG